MRKALFVRAGQWLRASLVLASFSVASMAPSIARCLAVSQAFHPLRASAPASKPFSTSAALLQRRKVFVPEDKSRRTRSVLEDDYELLESHMMIPADVNDSPSSGHLILQQQRILLQYMRLIEHEMPKLVGECLQLLRTK